jgi:hypothetical protein
LVPLKCGFNEKTRQYTGRAKVIGRIAGQMISVIFVLLKQDAEALRGLPAGAQPPPPVLYDPELHRQHRAGRYRRAALQKPAQVLELPSC